MCEGTVLKVVTVNSSKFNIEDDLAACIGFFDGLHKGHKALINETLSLARKHDLSPAMICFVPDPLEVIKRRSNPHVYSYEKRKQIAEEMGIETYIVINFDEEMMKMEPITFIKDYLNRMNIRYLIYGYDFRFGYKGRGDDRMLREYGNFYCRLICEYRYYGSKISSTRIKRNIRKGNFRHVSRLLGRDYELNLTVLNSLRKGDKWLIQAKTSEDGLCIPDDGVYEGLFAIENGIFLIESDSEMKPEERLDIVIHE